MLRSLIALMMEAVSTSETSKNFHQTTRRNIQHDSHLHTRLRENLKSQKLLMVLYSIIINSYSLLVVWVECDDVVTGVA
jgi:hypothetical protein